MAVVVHKLPVILLNVVMLQLALAIVWRVEVLRRRERDEDGNYASRLPA